VGRTRGWRRRPGSVPATTRVRASGGGAAHGRGIDIAGESWGHVPGRRGQRRRILGAPSAVSTRGWEGSKPRWPWRRQSGGSSTLSSPRGPGLRRHAPRTSSPTRRPSSGSGPCRPWRDSARRFPWRAWRSAESSLSPYGAAYEGRPTVFQAWNTACGGVVCLHNGKYCVGSVSLVHMSTHFLRTITN